MEEKQTRNLYQLIEIKETIVGNLAMDEKILKVLVNQGENALALSAPAPKTVMHKNIHPKKRAPKLLLVDQGNIGITVGAVGNDDGYFRKYSIVFYVTFPETMSYLMVDGLRVCREDYLAHLIDLNFDKARGYGIGKMKFGAIRDLEAPDGFEGVALYYESVDFA